MSKLTTENKIKKQTYKKQQQSNFQQGKQNMTQRQELYTPIKKTQNEMPQNIFSMMTPFLNPAKLSHPSTAITYNYNSMSNDMRMIQTPLNNKFNKLDVGGVIDQNNQLIHDQNLRLISNKIDWEGMPGKSDIDSLQEEDNDSFEEYQDEGQNDQNNQIEQKLQQDDIQIKQGANYKNNENPLPVNHDQLQQNDLKQQKNNKNSNTYATNIRSLPQHSLSKKRSFGKYQNKQVPEPNQTQNKKVTCNCKKTQCLKLYCDCFRINQTCDGCNCSGCHNLDEYAQERSNAILTLMDRNPDPFSLKIEDDKHMKGCNCKKSGCQKKYCQCFQAGLKCGDNCKCQECKNGGGCEQRQRTKRQRQIIKVNTQANTNLKDKFSSQSIVTGAVKSFNIKAKNPAQL